MESSGQELLYIKSKTELYSVLKGHPKLKHGDYRRLQKKTILESGQFDNGKKIGQWNYYNDEGKIEQTYDYSIQKIIVNNNGRQFSDYKIINQESEPETLPIFIGGRSRYDRFINDNLIYPKESKSEGIEGRQFVIITLSENGHIIESKIYRSITPEIDNEALRLISELPEEWLPAVHNNRNISVTFALPVLFKL